MNSIVRILLILGLLVGAVVGATLVYKRSAPDAIPSSGGESNTVAAKASDEPDEIQLTESFRTALVALQEGREDDALAIFESTLVSSPDYTRALQQMGVIYSRRGELEKALDTMLQLTANRPNDPETHALMGWVLYLAERYRDAEISALRVLELDPNHLATRYNLGLYRTAQNRTQEAVTTYIRAMKSDPTGAQVMSHRERLAAYHDAHTDRPSAHYLLAFFAQSMKDPESEIVELEHFLELTPAGAEADNARTQLERARATINGD